MNLISKLRALRSTRTIGRNQYGYSIIEIGIVLAVIAIAATGIILFGIQKFAEIGAKNEADIVKELGLSVIAYKQNRPNFAGLTSDEVRTSGRVPPARINGTNIVNGSAGTITFAPTTVTTANDAFTVTSTNLKDNVCKLAPTGIESLATSMSINGTVVKAVGATLVDTTVNASCTGDTNTIVTTFTK